VSQVLEDLSEWKEEAKHLSVIIKGLSEERTQQQVPSVQWSQWSCEGGVVV